MVGSTGLDFRMCPESRVHSGTVVTVEQLVGVRGAYSWVTFLTDLNRSAIAGKGHRFSTSWEGKFLGHTNVSGRMGVFYLESGSLFGDKMDGENELH